MNGILVFGGSGPQLLLSSYSTIDRPDLIARLEAKGLRKFIACEIPVDGCRDLYDYTYRNIAEDLGTLNDLRVPDLDGQRIFLDFSLRELGEHFVCEDDVVPHVA